MKWHFAFEDAVRNLTCWPSLEAASEAVSSLSAAWAARVGQEAKEGPAAADTPQPHLDLPPFDLFEPHFLADFSLFRLLCCQQPGLSKQGAHSTRARAARDRASVQLKLTIQLNSSLPEHASLLGFPMNASRRGQQRTVSSRQWVRALSLPLCLSRSLPLLSFRGHGGHRQLWKREPANR